MFGAGGIPWGSEMRKKVLGTVATTLLATLPGTSFPLGLGDIQLKSSLNAPLDAEIELVGATPDELAGLKVQLASRDTLCSGAVARPAATPAPAVPATPAASASPAAEGGTYRVRSGDSLSRIAANAISVHTVGECRRAMVAIYRANPGAFDGNMNLLRAGAVLHLPDAAALAAVELNDANAEIRRQYTAGQGGAAGVEPRQGSAANQLKLVPPPETKAATPTPATAPAGTPAAPAAGQATQQLQQRLSELENQLAQMRRELEQQRSAEAAAAKPAAPAAAGQPEGQPAAAPPPVPAPTAPAPEPKRPKVAPAAPSAGIFGVLKSLWYIPAGLAALAAAVFGFLFWRRRREEGAGEVPVRGLAAAAKLADAETPAPAEHELDLELLPETSAPSDTTLSHQLEPVSMSEIGTKLDLARAYIDMGDPDGARGILSEVLAEGDDGQKQAAQRLLDGLSG